MDPVCDSSKEYIITQYNHISNTLFLYLHSAFNHVIDAFFGMNLKVLISGKSFQSSKKFYVYFSKKPSWNKLQKSSLYELMVSDWEKL